MATGVVCWALSAQTPETKPVDQRHAEIKDDGVGPAFFRFNQSGFRTHGRLDLIPFETQHSGKRLRDALVVIDDQNLGRCTRRGDRHRVIVTDDGSRVSQHRKGPA